MKNYNNENKFNSKNNEVRNNFSMRNPRSRPMDSRRLPKPLLFPENTKSSSKKINSNQKDNRYIAVNPHSQNAWDSSKTETQPKNKPVTQNEANFIANADYYLPNDGDANNISVESSPTKPGPLSCKTLGNLSPDIDCTDTGNKSGDVGIPKADTNVNNADSAKLEFSELQKSETNKTSDSHTNSKSRVNQKSRRDGGSRGNKEKNHNKASVRNVQFDFGFLSDSSFEEISFNIDGKTTTFSLNNSKKYHSSNSNARRNPPRNANRHVENPPSENNLEYPAAFSHSAKESVKEEKAEGVDTCVLSVEKVKIPPFPTDYVLRILSDEIFFTESVSSSQKHSRNYKLPRK